MTCDAKKLDREFPPEKQFLITERVPCTRRIKDVESAANAIQEVALEDDWFEARAPEAGQDGAVVDIDNEMQVVDDMDAMDAMDNNGGAAAQEEEVADMDDLEDMDAMMEEENNN